MNEKYEQTNPENLENGEVGISNSENAEKSPLAEAKNLEAQIETGAIEIVIKGEQSITSGLNSLKNTDPEVEAEGKSITSFFTEKAEALKNKFLGKLKVAMLAFGLIAPVIAEGAPKQNEIVKDTIFVSDPNDSRLEMYKDSLDLYNQFQSDYRDQKKIRDESLNEYNKNKPFYKAEREAVDVKINIPKNEYHYPNKVNSNIESTGRIFLKTKPKNSIVNFTENGLDPGLYNSNQDIEDGQVEVYPKPTQPVIYKKEKVTSKPENSLVSDWNPDGKQTFPTDDGRIYYMDTNDNPVYKPKPKQRPKEKVIKIESKKADLLSSESLPLKIQKIPFKEGTYFTHKRDRQTQELGSEQFGREGLVDFFDKKTGKLLGTYPASYLEED